MHDISALRLSKKLRKMTIIIITPLLSGEAAELHEIVLAIKKFSTFVKLRFGTGV